MKKSRLTILTFIFPFITFSQTVEQTPGLDDKINEWFAPFANWVSDIIFYSISVTDKVSLPIVLILLVGGAFFFTFRFGFINFRRLGTSFKTIRGDYDDLAHPGVYQTYKNVPRNPEHTALKYQIPNPLELELDQEEKHGEISHFQALTAGLSGTIGLGNIAGVAVAIAIGGPGATFWIIIGGLIGMSTKFVECTLGVKYREIAEDGTVYGGPMYYLKKGFEERFNQGKIGNVLGILFAIFCVGAAFGAGNAFQSNQVAAQVTNLFNIQGGSAGFIIGIVLAILVGIVIIGGIKRIASFAEKIVPFMAIFYVLSSIFVIISHYHLVGDAFSVILTSAFSPGAMLGGFVGVMIVGFQRAAFSNEAGAGTSPIAHSAVKTRFPASEGLVGMVAPFVDTVIVCTMTALVIVFFNMGDSFKYGGTTGNVVLTEAVGGGQIGDVIGGVQLTSVAFEDAIPHFGIALMIAVIFFAFSTLISWSYYGIQSWKFLFGKSKASDLTFKILFLLFIVLGAGATLDAVITFSDAMIFAIVFPNMIGLILLFPVAKEEVDKYMDAIKAGKGKKQVRKK